MILSSLFAAFSGGATGILGGILSKLHGSLEHIMERKDKELERAHELKLLNINKELRETEKEEKIAVATIRSSNKLMSSSYRHDIASGKGSKWVVNLLRLVRPSITMGLIMLTGAIYFSLDETELDLKDKIINTVIYITSTAVLWWFGSRPSPRKN